MTEPLDFGLRFIVEPSGPVLLPEEVAILNDLKPAGIMLRRRNIRRDVEYGEWLRIYAELIGSVRNAIGRPNIIVCVDHEGGAVSRFPAPITRFPYPAAYASSDNAITEVSAMMAVELQSLGVNLSFSPVADIHSNPANPVINERAFGTVAADVARRAKLCARALRAGGIVPCAKHFPGHGDTSADSHYELPIVSGSKEQLDARELVPFRELIADGIEMIMSAHVMVPALDASNPATLSPTIMRAILRDELQFSGITIADALGMKAIHSAVGEQAFPARIEAAGVDLLSFVGDTVTMGDALAVRDQFVRAVDAGELDVPALQAIEARLSLFLSNLAQYSVHELPLSVFSQHDAVAQRLSTNAPWSTFHFQPSGFD